MKRLILAAALAAAVMPLWGGNPIVQTKFTTDPAPMVHGDTLYIYTGHDERGADFFWMQDWRVYSTTDMVNWTDHGSPLAIEDFTWADDRAWAPQCVGRDGKFYLYVPIHSKLTGTMAIGVAVGDTPVGPFRDAIGAPLADGSWDYIDPTVMIDDDGTAWLFWGNPHIYYCRLNPDMISIDGEIKRVVETEEGFGAPDPELRDKDRKYADCYTEGPWLMKRDGLYYLIYAAGGVPEHIAYSTAPSPEGPWTYRGVVMPLSDTGSFTNHSGTVNFRGHDYFFYHSGKLPGGGGFGRSVCVEEFKFNPDGTFPTILPTDEGVSPIADFNPYGRVEAETMAYGSGVDTEPRVGGSQYLSDIHNGDYTMLRSVNFRSGGPAKVSASVASALRGGTIEVRIDSLAGPLVATLEVPHTGGWEEWTTVEAPAQIEVPGRHDLYFVYRGRKGPRLFNIDYYIFE